MVLTRPTAEELAETPRLRWFVPVHGLTDFGCAAARHYRMGDPKPFERGRSILMFDHDLKVSEMQYRLERLCKLEGWRFLIRHADLNRSVYPDRLFGIDRGSGFRAIFHEEENQRKDFKALYEKARRYAEYHDSARCLAEWGWFRTFHVTWIFGSAERMLNFVRFLAGECRCTQYRGRLTHTCLPHGLNERSLPLPYFWFAAHTAAEDIGARIWVTPRDFASTKHALRDL